MTCETFATQGAAGGTGTTQGTATGKQKSAYAETDDGKERMAVLAVRGNVGKLKFGSLRTGMDWYGVYGITNIERKNDEFSIT